MPGIYDAAIQAGNRIVPLMDANALEHVRTIHADIRQRFEQFITQLPMGSGLADESAGNKLATYTDSIAYFSRLAMGHNDALMNTFLASALHIFDETRATLHDVVDVGCMFGHSGLPFAMLGIPTTFHDFPGIGLDFIVWYAKQAQIEPYVKIIPYGAPIAKHGMCIALDVLEHTGNHLATLRWFKYLGQIVAMTYPISIAWNAPFDNDKVLDEWVDDEAIGWVLQRRADILFTSLQYERRMMLWQ